MSQGDKKMFEEEKKYFVDSFSYIETFCSNGDNPKGIEYLMSCMSFCYTYFKIKILFEENKFTDCEKRKQNAIDITFLGCW